MREIDIPFSTHHWSTHHTPVSSGLQPGKAPLFPSYTGGSQFRSLLSPRKQDAEFTNCVVAVEGMLQASNAQRLGTLLNNTHTVCRVADTTRNDPFPNIDSAEVENSVYLHLLTSHLIRTLILQLAPNPQPQPRAHVDLPPRSLFE